MVRDAVAAFAKLGAAFRGMMRGALDAYAESTLGHVGRLGAALFFSYIKNSDILSCVRAK
jgi:hypothetical protein